jgi:imidazoleglycerol-phosphate dehydratase
MISGYKTNMRSARLKRESKETSVEVEINLDGNNQGAISTGVAFFDHMLEQFRKHSFIDLSVRTMGDHHIDDHHSVEDTGIVLGQAIKAALGERRGIRRYASARVVMDEALLSCDIDLGTRPYLVYDVLVDKERINTFETELCVEFWRALVNNMGACVHFHKMSGVNSHHIIEASFKAFAIAFDQAKSIDSRLNNETRTTKGLI